MKKWVIRKPNAEYSKKILNESDVSQLCADVLASRGFESAQEAAKKLFADKLYDPFLLKDMRQAADVINNAIENADRICVYGDYDCDGITSTVMLYSYLELMGADVMYRIPERSEGYGLNSDVVKEISEYGAKLIITVDNGISAINEAELIYEYGMKLVVTDHHQPGELLPRAEAVVNPHQRDCPSTFKNLCGAGVVLKLIAALEGGDYETALNEYGELAAIATIGDIVELSGENRYIVSKGLELIENSERCGINALIQKSGIKLPVDSTSVAFGIVPRINASGRFGSPTLAARLLLTDDEDEAQMLCEQLNEQNESRKKVENDIIDSIAEKINTSPDKINQRVIVLADENWYHGVNGIIAARILERFDKPTFIMAIEGDVAVGSARSFGDFSIYRALDYASPVLLRFGGHLGAGGFSLKAKDIPEFERLVQEYAKNNFDTMPANELVADKFLTSEEIDVENIEGLDILKPFGEGNREPVFLLNGTEILSINASKNGLHTLLNVKYGNKKLGLPLFRLKPEETFLKIGDKVDFMVTVDVSTYNGKKQINFISKDFRKCGLKQSKFFAAKDAYEKFRRGESLPKALYEIMCPDRNELVSVYNEIKSGRYNRETLYIALKSDSMNFCKLSICVDIFEEMKLINVNHFSQEISAVSNPAKTDINNSKILTGLKEKLV